MHKLEHILNKINESGLKCNIEKVFFGEIEIEYLSFWLTHDGVKKLIKNRSNEIWHQRLPGREFASL